MSKLIFKMNYSGTRWPAYLTELLGKDIADKCVVESNATAKSHSARIILYNFDGNKSTINTIVQNENTLSAYIINDKEVQKKLK